MSQDLVESFMWRMLKNFAEKIKAIFKQQKRNNVTVNKNVSNTKTETSIQGQIGETSKEINNDELKDDTEGLQSESVMLNQKDTDKLINQRVERTLETDQHMNNNSWLKNLLENNDISFHFTIFFLWIIVSILNVPAVLTWAHNYK